MASIEINYYGKIIFKAYLHMIRQYELFDIILEKIERKCLKLQSSLAFLTYFHHKIIQNKLFWLASLGYYVFFNEKPCQQD